MPHRLTPRSPAARLVAGGQRPGDLFEQEIGGVAEDVVGSVGYQSQSGGSGTGIGGCRGQLRGGQWITFADDDSDRTLTLRT